MLYQFGAYRLDPGERQLLLDDGSLLLTPKAFDLFVLLVESQGRLMTKDELKGLLWPESFVEEANLAQNISTIQKSLSEPGNGSLAYIETVRYR